LFDRCREDAACDAAFPNLKATFFALVARLDAQPVQVAIAHPTSGKVYPLLVDGDRLITDTFQLLYNTAAIPRLPKMISDMSKGDYALFSRWAGTVTFQWDRASEGKGASMTCAEDLAFSSPQAVEAASAQVHPRLREALVGDPESGFARCATWGVKAAGPVENEPVVSNIPTLVLAGEFDPVTPPAMGNLAAATLSQSYFFESPNTGHIAFSGGGFCTRDMATSFLNDPSKSPVYDCRPPAFFFALP
jgi:pimeloyl-ACP methyl ester carboxylesterase